MRNRTVAYFLHYPGTGSRTAVERSKVRFRNQHGDWKRLLVRLGGHRRLFANSASQGGCATGVCISRRLILGFGVLDLVSGDQGADQRAEKSLASFARVMDELEEPEVDREFVLRNAAMRPQPGAKQ